MLLRLDPGSAMNGQPCALFEVKSSTNVSHSLAYELNHLVSQRPTSVLSPTSTRLTSLNELEYLDVFDSFNYPRLRPASQRNLGLPQPLAPSGAQKILRFDEVLASEKVMGVTNTSQDWLNFQEPLA